MTQQEKKNFRQRLARRYDLSEQDIDEALLPFLVIQESHTLGFQKLGHSLEAKMEAFEKSISVTLQSRIPSKSYHPPSLERMSGWKAFWVTLAWSPYFSASMAVIALGVMVLMYQSMITYQQSQAWKQQTARQLNQQLHEKYFYIQRDGSLFIPKQNYQVVKGGIILQQK